MPRGFAPSLRSGCFLKRSGAVGAGEYVAYRRKEQPRSEITRDHKRIPDSNQLPSTTAILGVPAPTATGKYRCPTARLSNVHIVNIGAPTWNVLQDSPNPSGIPGSNDVTSVVAALMNGENVPSDGGGTLMNSVVTTMNGGGSPPTSCTGPTGAGCNLSSVRWRFNNERRQFTGQIYAIFDCIRWCVNNHGSQLRQKFYEWREPWSNISIHALSLRCY